MAKMDDLRKYYDNADTVEEMQAALDSGAAVWDTETVEDPMVGTSLRLPRSLLEAIRAEASARHLPTTTLIRVWITEALSQSPPASTPASEELGREVRELRQEVRALAALVKQRTLPEGKIVMQGRAVSKGVKPPLGKSAATTKSGVYVTPSPTQAGTRRAATTAKLAKSGRWTSVAKSALGAKGKTDQVDAKSDRSGRRGNK